MDGRAGMVTSVLVLCGLYATSAFFYIPFAALAAIILTSIVNLIDISGMVHAYHTSTSDFLVTTTTTTIKKDDITTAANSNTKQMTGDDSKHVISTDAQNAKHKNNTSKRHNTIVYNNK